MKVALLFACVIAFASAEAGYSTIGSSRGNSGYNYSPASHPSSSGAVVDNYVPKVFKHVYVHSAPDEEGQQENRVIRVPGGDKHVNVIFVKVPSSSSSAQTEVILPDQDEHKNLVYVLLQKNKAENDIKITRPQAKSQSKPEVHFIRYADAQSESDASPVSPPSGLYGTPQADPIFVAPAPEKPSGLYGTPQADPVEVPPPPPKPSGLYGTPQAEPVEVPPPKPSGLYGTPLADPVEVPPPPPKPSGLYGTPQADPVYVPPPPAEPSGFYGLPSL